jgi:hypothetical protein
VLYCREREKLQSHDICGCLVAASVLLARRRILFRRYGRRCINISSQHREQLDPHSELLYVTNCKDGATMVSTPDFIGHHTFWLKHSGWCSFWYPRGPGSPARRMHRSHSTYENPWRLSAHSYRDFPLDCGSPVAARPCEATWLLSSFRIWRAGATRICR